MSHRLTMCALVALAPLWVSAGFGQDTPPKDEKARIDEFRAFAKEEAASYSLRLEGSSQPLRSHPESVLFYTDPVVGGVYGEVFVWTADGRPEAVAAIYRFFRQDPHRGAAFHSLSLGKLTAERDGAVAWSPAKPGLAFQPIQGAPVPAGSAGERLRQMHALGREFTSRQTTRAGKESAMHLIARPVYRYRETHGDLIDGGLFVFVHGGAPEIFLLIEARRKPDGTPEWRFGATRMHGIKLELFHREKPIWTAPEIPWAQIIDPREPFWGFRVELPRQR